MSEDAAGGFAGLGLRQELLAELAQLGYEEPTPIQREAVPPLLAGRDLLGQAATGTGKTAAFALPLLERLGPAPRGPRPSALVLAPTRELAVQVSEATHRYGRQLRARVLPVYGGQPIGRQLRELERGVDVVVATPGRAIDLLHRGALVLDEVRTVVLDEADEMLDMGFLEDIDTLLSAAPKERQTVLFSATVPRHIESLARSHMRDAVRIQVRPDRPAEGQAPLVRQVAHLVARAYKPAALGRVLDVEAPAAAIVFCRTREEVDQLTETLGGRGYRAEALHGGMSQEQRDRVMQRLRAGTAELLIATDVAARGLDVDTLTHVVNYSVPNAPESYVHRIGRVGRAGREGVAITLAEPRERRLLQLVERLTGAQIPLLPLPTLEEARARQDAMTADALREGLQEGVARRWRALAEELCEELDAVDVAAAALQLAAQAGGVTVEESEIPAVADRPVRPYEDRGDRAERGDRAGGPGRPDRGASASGSAPKRQLRGPVAKLFVGAGRESGIRPQDLVGAITGESSLTGKDIGAIEIMGRFSLVEVPEGVADEVVRALSSTLIKGRKANVRRDQSATRPSRPQGARTT